MVLIDLDNNTLAILIAGIYCTDHQVESMAIPQSVWLSIAEKLAYFIDAGLWDFKKLSFEDWIATGLFIYPTELLDKHTIEDMMANTLYWETVNGNVILSVSMDIQEINQ